MKCYEIKMILNSVFVGLLPVLPRWEMLKPNTPVKVYTKMKIFQYIKRMLFFVTNQHLEQLIINLVYKLSNISTIFNTKLQIYTIFILI